MYNKCVIITIILMMIQITAEKEIGGGKGDGSITGSKKEKVLKRDKRKLVLE